jgi:aryl-phospho-beta-D-glucosidase BglC (GH1 family)
MFIKVALIALFTMSLSVTCRGEDAPLVLQTAGTELLYGSNRVMLRGVAVGDPFQARTGRPVSDYLRIAKEWNANVVRMGVLPSDWKSNRQEVLDKLASESDAALAAGMFVIIDWHCVGWPDGYFETGEAGDPPDIFDSNFALAKDFWEAASSKFGKDGRIVFEIWNEPIFDAAGSESNSPDRWMLLKPYWKQLTAIIRARSTNLILATGDNFAHNLRGIKDNPLSDSNTAYAWHTYAESEENDEVQWAASLAEANTVGPVVVTEWGFQANAKAGTFKGTPKTFGNKFVADFLEGKSLHSTAWCWNAEYTPPMLNEDWKSPNEYGEFVLKYLHSHASIRP